MRTSCDGVTTMANAVQDGQPRKFRLRVEINADNAETMSALVKQLSSRYGESLQVSEQSGDLHISGNAGDIRAELSYLEPKPAADAGAAEVATATAASEGAAGAGEGDGAPAAVETATGAGDGAGTGTAGDGEGGAAQS